MRFLIMTDIEGVTGVTTFEQAEKSAFGREMLMNDLLAAINGILDTGDHEIVVYDMHTDGRNVDISRLPKNIPVVMGKPINKNCYRGIGDNADGLFLLGLHAMQHAGNALLEHSYLAQYDSIHINGKLVGEIGTEALLAGERNIPLIFVSGDDRGCAEAKELIPGISTAAVKKSLGPDTAVCYSPEYTSALIRRAAAKAVENIAAVKPLVPQRDVEIAIEYSDCEYKKIMKQLHPEFFVSDSRFVIKGSGMLSVWSDYLLMETEMIKTYKQQNL
ncbi:MAG: M55 family metallopeptidase [Candidatus Limivicinus sp.]|jgi:D-amino peptidase